MEDFSLNRRWVLAGGLWLAAGLAGCSRAAANEVETSAGRVRGVEENGVLKFRGIPYGESTAGAGRFMPPKAKAGWTGVREAVKYGDSAQQAGLPTAPTAPGEAPAPKQRDPNAPPPIVPVWTRPAAYDSFPRRPEEQGLGQSEDCLVLNVWTPSKSGKRAVMFWLHGGGFSAGNGSGGMYEGANLATKHDVVLVTINHRLNVFGYCDLSAYGEQYADSGNVGMLDVVLALQWVKDNIAQFGGDPDRVMIHGQSGGGAKVSMLMGCPPAQGLFHRAAPQSGSALRFTPQDQSRETAAKLIAALGFSPADVAKIHDLDPKVIRTAAQSPEVGDAFRPVTGPASLPRDPFAPDADPISKDIPMVIGTCRTEDSHRLATDRAMDTLSDADLKRRVEDMVPAGKADEALALYERLYPDSPNAHKLYMIGTDSRQFLNSTLQAERKAALGAAPAWLWSFDWVTPVEGGRFYSPHSIELPFVFDNVEHLPWMVGEVTPEVRSMADRVSTAWTNFAKEGKPSAPGLPEWPAYDATTRPTMLFDGDNTRVANDPRSQERQLMLGYAQMRERQERA